MSLPQPTANGDSRHYWEAASAGRLIIRQCNRCWSRHFMPRHLCPTCWSDDLDWIESAGTGSVQSFTIVHRAPTPEFASHAPYVVALIDLDEGPRMMTNIVGGDALQVAIGDRVRVRFEDRGNGMKLPQFVRDQGGA